MVPDGFHYMDIIRVDKKPSWFTNQSLRQVAKGGCVSRGGVYVGIIRFNPANHIQGVFRQ